MNREKIDRLKTFKRVAWYFMLASLISMWLLRNFEMNAIANVPYVTTAISGLCVIIINRFIKQELKK
ncbi:hypothetical protein NC661_11450 [Aquibacillus koreensis]|uniref:Uncharacterized protein n=1 Tax=Aquibacillus koreensis TaxID=279446 RepID=A0A9X4AK14_9BACI|nr:hypothetical protein [Aquibacillus koreensis]MCT2537668.1 hypothetical protein [Aquibacillus koreensis]MDC3420985.1 hypothetical protein [Aquibacillus koreensis]